MHQIRRYFPCPDMYRTIYISNVLEVYHKGYLSLGSNKRNFWIQYDTAESNRALFYGGDDKVVVTTNPYDIQYKQYVYDLLNWKNVHTISPTISSPSLSYDCMINSYLHEELRRLITDNPGIDIIPYRSTPEFYELIDELKRHGLEFNTPETLPVDSNFVYYYANSKRGFRHIWERSVSNTEIGKKVFIPQGFINTDKAEAIEACWWFKNQNKSFVIKYNFGVQGSGVLLNDHKQFSGVKPDFIKQVQKLLIDEVWKEPCIIVEEMMEPDPGIFGGSPSIEYCIEENGQVRRVYASEQFLKEGKTFSGVYIHERVQTDPIIQDAFAAGDLFGAELSKLGYRGFFDVDLVVTKDKKVYAVEANLRRTGGTHTYETAKAILGSDNWHNVYFANEDYFFPKKINLDFKKFREVYNELLYTHHNRSGIILYNPEMLKVNCLSIFLIAKSDSEMKSLRQKTAEILGNMQ